MPTTRRAADAIHTSLQPNGIIVVYILSYIIYRIFQATNTDTARVARTEKNVVILPPPPALPRVVVCTARRAIISP